MSTTTTGKTCPAICAVGILACRNTEKIVQTAWDIPCPCIASQGADEQGGLGDWISSKLSGRAGEPGIRRLQMHRVNSGGTPGTGAVHCWHSTVTSSC